VVVGLPSQLLVLQAGAGGQVVNFGQSRRYTRAHLVHNKSCGASPRSCAAGDVAEIMLGQRDEAQHVSCYSETEEIFAALGLGSGLGGGADNHPLSPSHHSTTDIWNCPGLMDTPKSAKVSADGVKSGEERKTEAAEVFG